MEHIQNFKDKNDEERKKYHAGNESIDLDADDYWHIFQDLFSDDSEDDTEIKKKDDSDKVKQFISSTKSSDENKVVDQTKEAKKRSNSRSRSRSSSRSCNRRSYRSRSLSCHSRSRSRSSSRSWNRRRKRSRSRSLSRGRSPESRSRSGSEKHNYRSRSRSVEGRNYRRSRSKSQERKSSKCSQVINDKKVFDQRKEAQKRSHSRSRSRSSSRSWNGRRKRSRSRSLSRGRSPAYRSRSGSEKHDYRSRSRSVEGRNFRRSRSKSQERKSSNSSFVIKDKVKYLAPANPVPIRDHIPPSMEQELIKFKNESQTANRPNISDLKRVTEGEHSGRNPTPAITTPPERVAVGLPKDYKPPTTTEVRRLMMNESQTKYDLDQYGVKKIFIVGEINTVCSPTYEKLVSHQIDHKSYMSIAPHQYYCRDAMGANNVLKFAEVQNYSKPTHTFGDLLSNENLLDQWVTYAPDVTVVSLGLSDIKEENISWRDADYVELYMKRVEEVIARFKNKALDSFKNEALDKFLRVNFWYQHITLFCMLPTWVVVDPTFTNRTLTAHTVTAEQYKEMCKKINNMLRKKKSKIFFDYSAVFINPSLEEYSDLMGQPAGTLKPFLQLQYLRRMLNVAARVCCNVSRCRIDKGAPENKRRLATKSGEGCPLIYPNLI